MEVLSAIGGAQLASLSVSSVLNASSSGTDSHRPWSKPNPLLFVPPPESGHGCFDRSARLRAVQARAGSNGAATLSEAENRFDVSSNCVNPVFRSSPWKAEQDKLSADEKTVKILFLSEGNVCRSVYAEHIFKSLLAEKGLERSIICCSKATRDYNLGEAPDPRALQVAQELQISLPEEHRARVFDHAADVVEYDLLLVMDKFTAADVLREVSVYDTINKHGNYSRRVRRLGEFCRSRQIEEIDDPLYGNMGGPEEYELLRTAAREIYACCEGLVDHLLELRDSLQEGESFKEGVSRSLGNMEELDWLVPPMLQKR